MRSTDIERGNKMAIYKCKMCGGSLDITEGQSVYECEYCGTKQTLPRLDDEKRLGLYNRASQFRQRCAFDKAAGIYEKIVEETPDDAEAPWSLVLWLCVAAMFARHSSM